MPTSGLFLIAIFSLASSYFETVLAACLIGFFALLPAYLWCKGSVKGMPVFPVFALPFLWTYGLRLFGTVTPDVGLLSPVSHLSAALTISSFLGLGTFVWYKTVNVAGKQPVSYMALQGANTDTFFLFLIAAYAVVMMGFVGGWFNYLGNFASVLRSFAFGLGNLATFVLAYRLG